MPLATVGETSPGLFPVKVQAETSVDAFAVVIVFSNGLKPVWAGSNWYWGQAVCTVNRRLALRPLVAPVAVTVCTPGWAEAGTAVENEKFPFASVTGEPSAVVSNVTETVSLGPKPVP